MPEEVYAKKEWELLPKSSWAFMANSNKGNS